ncbi:MAG: NADH-quinone oxidoreductase subunit NuoK [Ardenticatenales bacterium]
MTPTIALWWYLLVAAALFSIGLFGALSRRNAVGVLMGIELMLNGANVNAVAFWRYTGPSSGGGLTGMDGQVFAIMVIALAAAEAAVGLALIISIYRSQQTVLLEDFTSLHG